MELILAVTPQNNEAFLREVDEELRRDQMMTFLRRWGWWLIVAIVLVVAAYGGWLWWQAHQRDVAAAEGAELADALESIERSNPAAATPKLTELAASDISGYRAQALSAQADILLAKDDTKGAAAKFAAIASDEKQAKPVRDLALLRQTSAEFDVLQPQTIVDRLRGLANKDSPWFGTAGEMMAAAYLRMNRPDLAGKLFAEIAKTETVPETIRTRVVQMAGVLGVDAVEQPDPTAQKPAPDDAEEKNAQ